MNCACAHHGTCLGLTRDVASSSGPFWLGVRSTRTTASGPFLLLLHLFFFFFKQNAILTLSLSLSPSLSCLCVSTRCNLSVAIAIAIASQQLGNIVRVPVLDHVLRIVTSVSVSPSFSPSFSLGNQPQSNLTM